MARATAPRPWPVPDGRAPGDVRTRPSGRPVYGEGRHSPGVVAVAPADERAHPRLPKHAAGSEHPDLARGHRRVGDARETGVGFGEAHRQQRDPEAGGCGFLLGERARAVLAKALKDRRLRRR
jgi:hypothetical protein